MKTKTSPVTNPMNSAPCRLAFLLLPLVLTLAWFAFSPLARAVCQEGCLTNNNTVLGDDALLNNTGSFNTAIGANALISNTTGSLNTALGEEALVSNTTGTENVAIGDASMFKNTQGIRNTATGHNALSNYTSGSFNTAFGYQALLGGDNGVAGESKTIRIGKSGKQTNTFIAGISGATVPTGVAVIVDASGHLGTTTSSARFKEAIKPMDKASEAILALKPVTFQYKKELDPAGVPQFGLVAENVEKVNPDHVARDDQGKAYTVRYEAVNAMLLNEFLKEHRTVQELKSTATTQEATIAQLKATVAKQEKLVAQQQKGMEVLTASLKEQ